ncbi:MAG: FAD-dependent oxidoreductase, partial [Thermoplasmata archaeon]|nr:FAD-dependent oxidoreductase [Thermoplasmata archaeon]
RKETKDIDITVITKGRHVAYSPCALPFVLHGVIDNFDSCIMKTPDDYEQVDIRILTETTVERIDLENQRLESTAGEIEFDTLVIATGSYPFIPPIPGVDAEGVCVLKTIEDAQQIEKSLESVENAVIVGAGAIGLEVGSAMMARGVSVTVVELLPYVLPLILDPDMAQLVHNHLMDIGARVICGAAVSEVLTDEAGKVRGVKVGDEEIPCQMVLMSTGVRPSSKLAKDAGIETGSSGGIVTDSSLHVKVGREYLPNVYASGDCVEVIKDFTYQRTISPLGTSAYRLARVVADNIMGRNSYLLPFTSPNVCVVGQLQVGSVGLTTHVAKSSGIQTTARVGSGPSAARYYPKRHVITSKLIVDHSRRIVGGQIISDGGGVKCRIDTLSVAMASKMKVDDFAHVETCYAPPVSALVDPLTLTAQSFFDVC